jgi:hypothetical protein
VQKTIHVCDYCGREQEMTQHGDPPKFVTFTIVATLNPHRMRSLRYRNPGENKGSGITNNVLTRELCLGCAVKPIFASLEIDDGQGHPSADDFE